MIAFPLSDNLVEVTLFGGTDNKGNKLSHTSILRFGELFNVTIVSGHSLYNVSGYGGSGHSCILGHGVSGHSA